MKHKLLLLALVFTLACGATLPTAQLTDAGKVYMNTHPAAKMSTAVKMTVTAETLNVRECAGTSCPVIDELERGEVVTCTDFDTPPEGVYQWCRHRLGWSSMQYLEVAK